MVIAQLGGLKGKKLDKAIGWARKRIDEIFADPSIHTFVLSNEGFLGKPFLPGKPDFLPKLDRQVAALARVLEGYRVEVRYFVRDFSGFLPSWYVQQVRMGWTQTFDEFLEGLEPDLLTWMPAVERLRATFGAGSVRCSRWPNWLPTPMAA